MHWYIQGRSFRLVFTEVHRSNGVIAGGKKKGPILLIFFVIYTPYGKNSRANVMGQVPWKHLGQRSYIKNHSSKNTSGPTEG